MIRFKQFLLEQKTFKSTERDGWVEHTHDLGTHDLHVSFNAVVPRHDTYRRNLRGNNHWNVSFSLEHKKSGNVTYNRSHLEKFGAKKRMGATLKLRDSISHFVQTHKPRSVEMNGNTAHKKNIYSRLSNALAKKHRGKRHLVGTEWPPSRYVGGTDDTAIVEFPHHKENIQ